MKIAIFGDVHGNLVALEKFIDFVSPRVDAFLCTGDLVNYGPWSQECVQIVKELPDLVSVRGNHEDIFLNQNLGAESQLVREFTSIAISSFSEFEWISLMPSETKAHSFTVSHTIMDTYVFKDSFVDISENRVIGHSHQQYIRLINGHLLVNPGSLGQNREFINLSQFVILDSESNSFEMFTLQHDISIVIKEMKVRGYSERCINYYTQKQRLN